MMVPIRADTRAFAVLGHPIGHTLSPAMQNAALRACGCNAVYLAFDVAPDRLPSVLEAMGAMGFGGTNLTVPLKEVAFRALPRRDASATLVGSVNTVAFTGDGPVGYSTDGDGFLRARAEAFGGTLEGARVFVLGTGGAGRALALVCAAHGAAALALADADPERADRVAAEVRRAAPGAQVAVTGEGERVDACRAADLVIQATPVGMNPGDPELLGREAFRRDQQVLDLVYTAPRTRFLAAAAAAGARVANGLAMLLHQGARAFEIWTGLDAPVEVMRDALQREIDT